MTDGIACCDFVMLEAWRRHFSPDLTYTSFLHPQLTKTAKAVS